jgi:hypothetical protein
MGNGLRIQMRQIYCSLYRLHRCLDGRKGAEGEPEGTEQRIYHRGTENTGCGKWIKQAGRTFIKLFGIPRFELRIANFELRNNCIRFSSNPQSAIHHLCCLLHLYGLLRIRKTFFAYPQLCDNA